MALQRLHSFETFFCGEKEQGEIVAIVAPTKQGKSELAKAILRENLHKFDLAYLFTSGSSFKQYQNYFWPSHVFVIEGTGKKDLANAFLTFCLQMQALKTRQEDNGLEPFKILVMFDDLSSQLLPIDSFTKTRHYNMSVLILTHSLGDLSASQRDQVAHWVLNQTLRVTSFKPMSNSIPTPFYVFTQTRTPNSSHNFLAWLDKDPDKCLTVKLDDTQIQLNKDFILPLNNYSFEQKRLCNYIKKVDGESIDELSSFK